MTVSLKSMVMLDRVVSVVLIVVCAILYRISGQYPAGGDYFPKFSLSVIILMSILMLVLSFRRGKTEQELEALQVKRKNVRPLIVSLIFIAYLIVFPTLGFYMSTALFVAVTMAFLKVRSLKLYLTVIPGLALVFYGFFGLILKVPFPESWLI